MGIKCAWHRYSDFILNGKIRRRFTRDPRGARYEVVGVSTDGRQVAIICRIKDTGKLLFITTYVIESA
jgi:hypothetical protein